LRLLLDTHALIWWLRADPRLGASAKRSIEDRRNQVMVSAVSAFEVTAKHRLGTLPDAEMLARDFDGERQQEGFLALDITIAHAAMAGKLPGTHRDPFDRLLIAQALLEDLALVSNEAAFDGFGVQRLW
jgi:PIN domain nuclease of toxin-antitoxin system